MLSVGCWVFCSVVVVVVVVGSWQLADLLLHGQIHLKLHHIITISTLSTFQFCAYHHASRDRNDFSTIQPTTVGPS